MEWAVGVTTVPDRICEYLPLTLESLRRGGFTSPRLIIDGCEDPATYAHFGMECTTHWPRLGAFGNWWLGMWELYIRQPRADRYAIFQDDILCVQNLRQYLETSPYPDHGYCSLILYPRNKRWCPTDYAWYRTSGWRGMGAQGLVFSHEAMMALIGMTNANILNKPASRGPKDRPKSNLDGAIADTMNACGWGEYVHSPSLITHIGDTSAIGNGRQPSIQSFLGEDCDATLLR